jgi:hypothetical protein
VFRSSSPSARRLLVLPVVLVALLVWAFLTANTGEAADPGAATGTVSAIGPWQSTLTIQTHTRRMRVIAALQRTADDVTRGDFPYVWAGGHAAAGVASTGGVMPRRGKHPKQPPIGFDCSGAVAAVLAGAGLWTPGSAVPNDADLVGALLHAHVIARGTGRGSTEVTMFDKPGVHVFMRIDGRYFGTSDGLHGNASQPHGGAGWLDDGAPDAHSRAFKSYHVIPGVLGGAAVYGQSLTFLVPVSGYGLLDGLTVGQRVRVSYRTGADGTLTARAITPAR